MGGIGKTCLIRHLVNLEDFAEWNIFWLPTETEEELKASFSQAAAVIDVKIKDAIKKLDKKKKDADPKHEYSIKIDWTLAEDFENQLGRFYNLLGLMSRKTMLIFDNADDKYSKFDDSRLAKYFSRSIKKHF